MPFANSLTKVSSGRNTMCGIEAKGTVACWGALNDEPYDTKGSPTRIPRLHHVESVAVGWMNACALKPSGQVACWSGWQGPIFTRVPNHAHSISGGGRSFCALEESGRIRCWEEDIYACPGIRRVQGIEDARQLSVDGQHGCAVRRSGKVACWGLNDDGELGIGQTAFHPAPIGVLGLPAKHPLKRRAPATKLAPRHPPWSPEQIGDDCCARAARH